MHRYICKVCDSRVDAGELHGGICDTCHEKERSLEIRKEWNQKMLARNVVERADGQYILGGTAY